MNELTESIKYIANEYGADVSALSVGLAIEAFRDIRNYPASYDASKVLSDMQANINKIAMAAVEIDSKDGMENQTAHNENGTSRTYANGILAYRDVVGFAHAI